MLCITNALERDFDVHQPLEHNEDLASVFTWRQSRRVSASSRSIEWALGLIEALVHITCINKGQTKMLLNEICFKGAISVVIIFT